MAATNAVLKVILRSGQTIESPQMPREEAEKELAEIGKIRGTGDELSLSWIQVHGAEILAGHLEERHPPF